MILLRGESADCTHHHELIIGRYDIIEAFYAILNGVCYLIDLGTS